MFREQGVIKSITSSKKPGGFLNSRKSGFYSTVFWTKQTNLAKVFLSPFSPQTPPPPMAKLISNGKLSPPPPPVWDPCPPDLLPPPFLLVGGRGGGWWWGSLAPFHHLDGQYIKGGVWDGRQFSLPRGSGRVRTPGRPCTGMQEPNKVKLLV